MKKILILLIPVLGLIACSPGGSSFYYENVYAFADVSTGGSLVLSPQGTRLQVTEDQTDGKWMQEQTVIILCDLTGITETGAYETRLKMYEPVTRKAVLTKSTADPAVYGTDAVTLYQDWGSDPKARWLNVSCLATSLKNSETPHTIDLVVDDVRSNADTVYLELHHQGSGESFENEGHPTSDFQVDTYYLRFDLSGAIPADAGNSIVLSIEWDWFKTENGNLLRDQPIHDSATGTFNLKD